MPKYTILSIILTFSLCLTAKTKTPHFLQPGDSIAIISPASAPNPLLIQNAVEVLTEWGYKPVVGKHAADKFGTFGSTIPNRLSDLRWAFENPSIKAVLATRGGYGCVQLLCELPSNYFKKYPKWMIGFSDITALHSALVSNGIQSIHASMAEPMQKFGGKDTCSVVLRNLLAGELPTYVVNPNSYNRLGKSSGILLGGNLSILSDMMGSHADMLKNNDNIILFIEDLSESIENVDRMLHHLMICGIFDRAKGVIVGNFKGYKPSQDYQDMYDLVKETLSKYNFPVAYNFPVGHVDVNFPLIEGANVTLDVAQDKVTLKYDKSDSQAY